ncbi:MAG: LPS translocon maturation chaperone LptM [Enterobacteriaceae bacterium]
MKNSVMKNRAKVIMVVLAAQLLVGCGLKGPLYMPKDKPQPAKTQPAKTEQPAAADKAESPAQQR